MLAREWKGWYARERSELAQPGLEALLDAAPRVAEGAAAVIFPHTKLRDSGALPAAAARWALESGCDQVLALGVLHGARESDAGAVRAARAGDPAALAQLRRVHGPGTAGDAGHWTEEFSLDGFRALLECAARRAGRPAPRVIERYPFLVGERPGDLPGLDELARLLEGGAALVATADPIHHGAGYGTPAAEQLPREPVQTLEHARSCVQEGLELLAKHSYREFLEHAQRAKSDFRDAGPALAELLGPGFRVQLADLTLVDYCDVFGAPAPTWVAGALAAATR
jgi:hypothetical protein